MSFVHRSAFAFPCALSIFAAACGGGIESPEPGTGAPNASPGRGATPPVPTAGAQADAPSLPASPSTVQACHAQPRQSAFGLDSCDVARESMTLSVAGITWADPALAWKEGGHAWLEVRYQNASEHDAIEYPGVAVTSSDARAQTDSVAHGDPIVRPDLYALSPCMIYPSRDHSFTLLSALPSGTKLTFTVSAAVADGNGISTCSGTLPTATLSVVAP